jgi:hypothetical protein
MSIKLDSQDFVVKAKKPSWSPSDINWDESKHPRVPAGSGDSSGEFTESGGGLSYDKGRDLVPKVDKVLARVKEWYKNKGISNRFDKDMNLKNASWIYQYDPEGEGYDMLRGCAGNILKGEVTWGPDDYREDMPTFYGMAGILMKKANSDKFSAPIQRYISSYDPMYEAKVGQVFDLPLASFSKRDMINKGDVLEEGDSTKFIRFDDPKNGYDIQKNMKNGEVIFTGRVLVKKVAEEDARITLDNGKVSKTKRTVITVVRA